MTDPSPLSAGQLRHFLQTHSIPRERPIRVRLPNGEVVDAVSAVWLPGNCVLIETEPSETTPTEEKK